MSLSSLRMRIREVGMPSDSAHICVSTVSLPWPISAAPMSSTAAMPSSLIFTIALACGKIDFFWNGSRGFSCESWTCPR